MPNLSTSTPFSFILFGASGNLAKLKIYPAIYTLALKKRLPEQYAVVGFARTKMERDEFRKLVEESIKADMPEVNAKVLKDLLSHVHYHQGAYDQPTDFAQLRDRLKMLEEGWKNAVRVAYLSIPPQAFSAVITNLSSQGVKAEGQEFRCIVEKPVGHNSVTAQALQQELYQSFKDEEVYFLDHYLGKEAVRNVYYLRYANPLLERLFKTSLIHHVEISAKESVGLEGRAGYFDSTGTFRDMFQSHLLMVACLLTMEIRETEAGVRDARLHALKQLYLPPATSLDDVVIQGQYTGGTARDERVVGYLEEEGIDLGSRTNTFAGLKLMSREARWQGVPFFLRSGKRLGKKETRISIQFNEPHSVGEGSSPNRLDIILQGEAGMRMYLQTKLGGSEPKFRPLILEDPLVCMGDCLPEHGVLILEAIRGKTHWFLHRDEVLTSWRLVDPVQSYLEKLDTPLYSYHAGSTGPEEADQWIERHGAHWFN
jgi:glucose-6-phosphate 1-dehydrogenase